MSCPAQPARLEPVRQAWALATALHGKGLAARVLRKGGHRLHPCVLLATGPGWAECVYAAPDYDHDPGQWWFWWSSLEPIAPISEVTAAADEVAGAFARACGPLPGQAAGL